MRQPGLFTINFLLKIMEYFFENTIFLLLGRRQRRLPVDGPARPALHRPHRVDVGNVHQQHGRPGQVVLPPGGGRGLPQSQVSGKF